MKPYAEVPARATRQLVADVLALCWMIAFVALAEHSRTQMLTLRAPASGMIDAGNGVSRAFAEMANLAQLVPFVGSQLAGIMTDGQQVGQSLTNAGQQQFDSVTGLASGTALLVVLVGALPLAVAWLPTRLRYARDAAAAVIGRDTADGTELLALHALSRIPARQLRTVAPNPVAAWRGGDPEVVRKLAALELDRLGLHPHRPGTGPPH
jgi:hypothetical protein